MENVHCDYSHFDSVRDTLVSVEFVLLSSFVVSMLLPRQMIASCVGGRGVMNPSPPEV
jgi:hypothetical protein